MRKVILFTMLIVVATAVGGCEEKESPKGILLGPPPNPDPVVIATNSGKRFTGDSSSIEIWHLDSVTAPNIEVSFVGLDSLGQSWVALAIASSDFLDTLILSAEVIDGSLNPGNAMVQLSLPGADNDFSSEADNGFSNAPSGLLTLRLEAGRLVGEASEMDDEFAAKFDGPFYVTCIVPWKEGDPVPGNGIAPPIPDDGGVALVIDPKFETELCKPYKTLGGWSPKN